MSRSHIRATTTRIVVVVIACVVALIASSVASAGSFEPKAHHDFCIVGGGPAGIQVAYLMTRYGGMDYALFERNSGPGSFFNTYPRQRNLISINKVYTGTNDTEFNLRHDWNSLLNHPDDFFFSQVESSSSPASSDEPVLFPSVSLDYYPKADTVPRYLELFLEKHSNLNIVFGADVATIVREATAATSSGSSGGARGKFHLAIERRGADKKKTDKFTVTCNAVIMASGKHVERRYKIDEGSHLVTAYSDAPTDPAAYTNQEVLILGAGNSAFEIARSLESHAAIVHIASRHPIQMAFNTHYVGDVRSVNLAFLDRYQLKSMDVLMTLATPDIRRGRLYRDNETGRIKLRNGPPPSASSSHTQDGSNKDAMAEEARMMEEATAELFPSRRGYHHVISCLGFGYNSTPFQRGATEVVGAAAAAAPCGSADAAAATATAGACGSSRLQQQQQQGNANDGNEKKFEPVVPLSGAGDSLLEIASNYESVNVPDLFAAGTLAHFRDFKRSAGGFIHGFRYTARTLVAMLRERYAAATATAAATSYPSLACPSLEAVLARMLWRLKNVSSLYQMQGQLTDVVIVPSPSSAADARSFRYFHDLPLDNVKTKWPELVSIDAFKPTTLRFVTLTLEFGKDFQGVGTLQHHPQKETYKRRAEKMLWDPTQPTTDPDFRLTRHRAQPGMPLPAVERVTAVELMMRDEQRSGGGGGGGGTAGGAAAGDAGGFMPASPGKTTLLHPLEPPPTMLPAKDGRPPRLDRFLFLHPVLREWKRTPVAASNGNPAAAGAVKHQLIREVRLHEDVLNDFTGKHYHETPMRKFLERALLVE